MKELINMLRNKCRDAICTHCGAGWKLINMLRNEYRKEKLWHNLGLYWKAYEDYCKMCEENDTKPDKTIPFYAVWSHDSRTLFMALVGAGLAFGICVLCNLDEPKIFPGAAIVEIGICLGAIYQLVPAHYREYAKHYQNLVYIRLYTDAMAYRLDKDVVRLTTLVRSWREQKAKEADERKRQAKMQYIGMFRALKNYAEAQFGIRTPDSESEWDDGFVVIFPNLDGDKDGQESATIARKFDYSQIGLFALIQEITKAITAQAKQKGQSEISALLETMATPESGATSAD